MFHRPYVVWTGLSLVAALVGFAALREPSFAQDSNTRAYAYICDTMLGAALEVDLETRRVRRVFPAENHPRNLQVSVDRSRLYLANTGWTIETDKRGSISVFSLKNADYDYAALLMESDGSTGTSAWWDWNNPKVTSQTDVIVDFEWWGPGDDIDKFSRLSKAARDRLIFDKRAYFQSIGVGFLLPFSQPLPADAGCHGAMEGYFSPSNKYSCQNEDVIIQALADKSIYLTADTHSVPSGGSTILRWGSHGATSCLDPHPGPELLASGRAPSRGAIRLRGVSSVHDTLGVRNAGPRRRFPSDLLHSTHPPRASPSRRPGDSERRNYGRVDV